jgi:hypothetical protein
MNDKDVEGSGCGLTYGTIPEFAWRDREKPRNTSVRIAGLWPEMLIWYHPNRKKGCQPLSSEVGM